MANPRIISGIRNITVSGRIASGATTLAQNLANKLNWKLWEGGKIVEEYYSKKLGKDEQDTALRPDEHEIWMEEKIKDMLKSDSYLVIQSHLAGFDAYGIEGIFKIVVVCEDRFGVDQTGIRVDRLANRKGITITDAKKNVFQREAGNLKKWRRLYAGSDQSWVYWDKKYYDLIVNTYTLNQEDSLVFVLKALGLRSG